MNKGTNSKRFQRNQAVTFEVDMFDTDTLHNRPTKFIGIVDDVMYDQYIRFKYLYRYEEESICLYDGLWDITKLIYTRPSSVDEFDWLLDALRNDNLHYCTGKNKIITQHDVEDMFDWVIKSGDYITITTDENSKWTCIFNETLDDLPNDIRLILCYVTCDVSDDTSYAESLLSLKTREDGTACLAILDAVRSVRFATEDEIEDLDEMISKHGLKFDKADKCLIPTEAKAVKTDDAFDWSSLTPFTPVLVRTYKYNYNCNGEWVPDFFYKMKTSEGGIAEFYTISTRNLTTYDECVPYNDETKHLIDSDDDAPSKYSINKYSENVKFCDKSIILY